MNPSSVFFVTGAGRGIGAATVELCVSEGHRVVACDVDADSVRELTERLGEAVYPLCLDVREEAQWKEALDLSFERMGGIDVVVNNAGLVHSGLTRELSSEQIQHMVDVNFLGLVNGCRAVIPRLVVQGHGHIVNVGSLAGFAPLKGQAVYCATKHAVRAFHHALAIEHTDDPISFSLVCPGPVDTGMLHGLAARDSGALAFAAEPIPPGQVAQGIFRAAQHELREVLLPATSGGLLRIAGTFPGLVARMTRRAEAVGRRALKRRRKTENASSDTRYTRV